MDTQQRADAYRAASYTRSHLGNDPANAVLQALTELDAAERRIVELETQARMRHGASVETDTEPGQERYIYWVAYNWADNAGRNGSAAGSVARSTPILTGDDLFSVGRALVEDSQRPGVEISYDKVVIQNIIPLKG